MGFFGKRKAEPVDPPDSLITVVDKALRCQVVGDYGEVFSCIGWRVSAYQDGVHICCVNALQQSFYEQLAAYYQPLGHEVINQGRKNYLGKLLTHVIYISPWRTV